MSDTVIVALCGLGVALLGSPVLVAWLHRRTKEEVQEVKKAIGTPNGQGDLVTMAEKLLSATAKVLEGQADQDSRLAKIEQKQAVLTSGHERLTSDVGHVSSRLATVENLQLTHEARIQKAEAALRA